MASLLKSNVTESQHSDICKKNINSLIKIGATSHTLVAEAPRRKQKLASKPESEINVNN